MPDGIGETLTTRWGPLPVWAWVGGGTAVLGGVLYYRNKKNQAAQQQQASQQGLNTNLGTVPVSNLTTQAQPMPIQLGDTFVNYPPPPGGTPTITPTGNPATTALFQQPAADSLNPGGLPAPTPPSPTASPPASGGVITGG